MDRSTVITLVNVTYTKDALGQKVPAETTSDVFANIQSVSRSEWAAAGQMGLKPDLVATMFEPEYDGQEIVVINSVRYGVYRTYRARNEKLELYLEKKTGVTNG